LARETNTYCLEMISTVVVTYNRRLLLQNCINNLLSQDINEDFEIIIVDNCSSDNTEGFIRRQLNNRIKFIRNENRLNIWNCKKLAVKYSSGDIIAFIDDDCLAEKNWLKVAKNSLSNCDFVGGVVLPASNVKFPWWWRKSLDWLVGINTEPGEKFLPPGSNMVFRKYVLDRLHKDEQNIILEYNRYLPYAEDNYRVKKALSLGFSMKINPEMIVYHQIPANRLKIAYLVKRSYREGRAKARYAHHLRDIFSLLAVSLPYHMVRLFISLDINYVFRIICDGSFIFHCLTPRQMNNCLLRLT